jgi:hypothetical protein
LTGVFFAPRAAAFTGATAETFVGDFAVFLAGAFAGFLTLAGARFGALPAAFLTDPLPVERPAVLRAGARAGFAAFFAVDFRGADFFAAAFFAGRRAVFFAAAFFAPVGLDDFFFAGARFAVRDDFLAGAFPAGFLADDFFAGALRAFFTAGFRAAFFAVDLREDFPAVFFAPAFDVDFFTLFPDAFLVVLLTFRDALADRAGFFLVPAEFRPAFFAVAFLPPDFRAFAVTFRAAAFRALFFPLACETMLTSQNGGLGNYPAGCVV